MNINEVSILGSTIYAIIAIILATLKLSGKITLKWKWVIIFGFVAIGLILATKLGVGIWII